MRVNFVGELGWELHHPIEYQNHIFDILMEAGKDLGLKPLGALWSATALIDEKYNHLVTKMHQQFIDAGSDLIVTNNFSVRKIRLKEFNIVHMFEEALLKAALLAKLA